MHIYIKDDMILGKRTLTTKPSHCFVERVVARKFPQLVLCLVVRKADGAGLVFHVFRFAVSDCKRNKHGPRHQSNATV